MEMLMAACTHDKKFRNHFMRGQSVSPDQEMITEHRVFNSCAHLWVINDVKNDSRGTGTIANCGPKTERKNNTRFEAYRKG
jgi:hypothetical protein